MIKHITKKAEVVNSKIPVEPFCKRLAEELEERYELVTCKSNYCSAWYVN